MEINGLNITEKEFDVVIVGGGGSGGHKTTGGTGNEGGYTPSEGNNGGNGASGNYAAGGGGGAGAVGRESLCYVMERAWPFAVDAVPLQFGTAQLTKVTAQFYYTRHHVIRSNIKTSAGFTPEQILGAVTT